MLTVSSIGPFYCSCDRGYLDLCGDLSASLSTEVCHSEHSGYGQSVGEDDMAIGYSTSDHGHSEYDRLIVVTSAVEVGLLKISVILS